MPQFAPLDSSREEHKPVRLLPERLFSSSGGMTGVGGGMSQSNVFATQPLQMSEGKASHSGRRQSDVTETWLGGPACSDSSLVRAFWWSGQACGKPSPYWRMLKPVLSLQSDLLLQRLLVDLMQSPNGALSRKWVLSSFTLRLDEEGGGLIKHINKLPKFSPKDSLVTV